MGTVVPGRFRITLFGLLVASFALLTAITAALILVLSHGDLRSNTRELLRQKSEVVVHSVVEKIVAHRQSTETMAAYLADVLAAQPALAFADEAMAGLLASSLAAAPHISTVALVDDDFRLFRVSRTPRPDLKPVVDWSDEPSFADMIRLAKKAGRPLWGPLFFSEHSGTTFINYLQPVEQSPYVLLLSISINDLSDYLRRAEAAGDGKPFILYDRHAVLAHATLVANHAGLDDRHPLPALERFSDPVLRSIWSADNLPKIEPWFANGLAARVVDIGGTVYVFLYREISGYGPAPVQVGTYFALDTVAPQIARNRTQLLAGIGLIALALVAALLLSRTISRPFRMFKAAAEQIGQLRFDTALALPESRIAEVRDLNRALRAMVGGLSSFKSYVPTGLVRRLMEETGAGDIRAEEKTISVMFTDIVGFTALAETMNAADVVALLNEHFALVDTCIEAEGGVIDKYIGDSVMAFWGGLEADEHHAGRACAAALRIEAAIERNNHGRRARGLLPVHVRIGIHTGRAMVGNIGASARISYTVIGDTVNVAARLEEFARNVDDRSHEALTVVSGETAAYVGAEFALQEVGTIALRGRSGPTAVYRLGPPMGADRRA